MIGYPYKAFTNPLFYVKLSLIALAIYLVVKIRNEVLRNPQDRKGREQTSMWKRAKVLAGLSLAHQLAQETSQYLSTVAGT